MSRTVGGGVESLWRHVSFFLCCQALCRLRLAPFFVCLQSMHVRFVFLTRGVYLIHGRFLFPTCAFLSFPFVSSPPSPLF